MFEAQGYKKWEDKTERVGEHVFQTKRYQKRVDWSIRFARSVLKAAEDKKKMGNNNVLG